MALTILALPGQALATDTGEEVGRLSIPAIGLEEPVRHGIDQWVIDLGVAYWPGTAQPGEAGNLVLAGHRTVETRPFYDLDLLEPGDLIHLAWEGRESTVYRVTETFVVPPTGVWIIDPTEVPILTMFSCHPKGSAAQRIVVRAELIEPLRLPADAWII